MRRLTCEGQRTGQRCASLPSQHPCPPSFVRTCMSSTTSARSLFVAPIPPLRMACVWPGLGRLRTRS